MKNLIKSMALLAVAAMGLSACNEQNLTPEQVGKGEFVTVHFGANSSIEPATKATLITEDEATFKSAWENGDALSVEYYNGGTANTTGKVEAKWVDATSSFDTTLPEYTGTWTYDAVYPAPDAEGEVDFGSARVQNGNLYNSKYDLMFGEAVVENASAGKTDDGKDVIFNMDRQTGIVYFHLTSALDEEVVSATLSVSEVSDAIASSCVMSLDYSKGFEFDTKTAGLRDITITFEEGTAPKAKDFQLWFNVLPAEYDEMTLQVETTGHTLDMKRTVNTSDHFVAGKLYKTVATVPDAKWVAKEKPEVYNLITFESELEDGEYIICMALNDDLAKRQYLENVKGAKPSTIAFSDGISLSTDLNTINIYPSKINNAKWSFASVSNGYSISSCSDETLGLGTTSSNDGLTIQDTYKGKAWSLEYDTENSSWLLQYNDTKRYLTVYSLENPRTYANSSTNVNGKIYLYKKESTPKTALETPANLSVSAAKVVSWDAVSGAASYNVTIGSETYTSETNSYDAAAIEDEYYDVSVVAVPSDKDNYKNSAAATLTAVKFGTPTLATPVLKEGLVDDASVNVTWTADSRATNGYKCEIYNGETLVESKDVTDNAVEFTELTAETSYTVKVQAKAVEGTKAYAASEIATLSVTTKAAGVQANDGTKEYPYTAAEAITVIDAGADLNGKYVKGVVAADPAPSFNSKYNSLTYYITSGGATIQIYSGRDLGDSGFVGTEDLNAGDEVVVFGTLKKYNSIYELDKENYLISINGKTEIYRGLEISGQKTSFTVGDAFEFGGKVLQVWRGKDAVDVTTTATFSGYDMLTEGTQTVTVTVGAETLTYEIKVNPAGTIVEKSETIDLSKGSYANNVITWSGTSCSFVQSKNTSSTNVNSSYVAKPRWYKEHKVAFTANEGYTITKVEVTCTSDSYATALRNSTYTNSATASVSGSVVTITTTGDFVITLGAQSRIQSVKVYYNN